ncbi:hypothetical protein [Kitasatospora sp. MAP12-44]|uniref:hypothetical protein n=1 Tax=Kitasatospora sp. MAP12-44 TaxID=3035099 RepID=UPI002476D89E|nr:hypothetical protein [Kitasatospora sp. MAP12-44]
MDDASAPVDACWLVELAGVDGRRYTYRVYAPEDALPGDLFWSALHHHDAGPLPRALDLFDSARIRPLTPIGYRPAGEPGGSRPDQEGM